MCGPHHRDHATEKRKAKVAKGVLAPIIKPAILRRHPDGYLVGYAPDHPLSTTSGNVLDHRRVAYNKYGEGPHPCHWCSVVLEWRVIQVDHLDWVRDNNHPDNLVVSCQPCNNGRQQRCASPQDIEASKRLSSKLRQLAVRFRD